MFTNLITDVDGVLTDGGFYYSGEGKILKKFGPHDNDGFKMLVEMGIQPVAISADMLGYSITKKRMEDMGIPIHLVSASTRYKWINDRYDFRKIIFVGDGYFDIECIKASRYGVAPSNAPDIVKAAADFVTTSCGGNGVILEIALSMMNEN